MRLRAVWMGACLLLAGCITSNTENPGPTFGEIGRAMMAAGGALRAASPPAPNATIAPGSLACHKTGEAISGFNKLCYYDCMGSANVKVIGSVELCPLTM